MSSPRPSPQTLGELRESGYRLRTLREELLANLLAHLKTGEPLFPGILGYEETVVGELLNEPTLPASPE